MTGWALSHPLALMRWAAEHEINPRNRPCCCYGAPSNCVWLAGTLNHLLGYRCGTCGHQWRIGAEQRGKVARHGARQIGPASTE